MVGRKARGPAPALAGSEPHGFVLGQNNSVATANESCRQADIAFSNSLADLAARIKAEHEAIKISLRESVQHAFAAGELLIEAKKQLKHGQWLPWLSDHCTISERTAQLYMRCAKSRAEIEKSATGIADLTLTEAAAMLMMSSEVKKLFEYIKKVEHLSDPEEIMQVALDSGVATYGGTIDYESDHTVEERREWDVFILFMVRVFGFLAESADGHVCWLKRRGYKSPSEWMGEEGDKDRRRFPDWVPQISDAAKKRWFEFLAETKNLTRAEINEAIGEADPNPKTKDLRAQHEAVAREAKVAQKRRANAQRALRIS